jgi:hypothetical protein
MQYPCNSLEMDICWQMLLQEARKATSRNALTINWSLTGFPMDRVRYGCRRRFICIEASFSTGVLWRGAGTRVLDERSDRKSTSVCQSI